MPLNTPVALDEPSFRELQRELSELRQQTSNLQRTVAHLIARTRTVTCAPPRRIKFRNDSSETAPAWGVMRITGATVKSQLTIDKPDATYRWLYLVNCGTPIPTTKTGFGTFLTAEHFRFLDNYVLYDTGATPAYGERWGPKSGEWKLFQHRPGFWILGGNNTESGKERTVAIQIPPGEVRVKNDDAGGSYAAGGTGRTFGVYGGSAGTDDTGLELPLTNGSSVAWATDKYGWATADGGGPIFLSPYQT